MAFDQATRERRCISECTCAMQTVSWPPIYLATVQRCLFLFAALPRFFFGGCDTICQRASQVRDASLHERRVLSQRYDSAMGDRKFCEQSLKALPCTVGSRLYCIHFLQVVRAAGALYSDDSLHLVRQLERQDLPLGKPARGTWASRSRAPAWARSANQNRAVPAKAIVLITENGSRMAVLIRRAGEAVSNGLARSTAEERGTAEQGCLEAHKR